MTPSVSRASRWLTVMASVCLGALAICAPAMAQPNDRDPNVHPGGRRFKNDREVVSPLILQQPLYACADTVVVKGFVPSAQIEIFVAGTPAPVGSQIAVGIRPEGETIGVSSAFTAGQDVTAVQIVNGVRSGPSSTVTVRNYREDYPSGLPQPRLDPTPCLDCGWAVGINDVIPGATWSVFAEDPGPGGTFASPVQIGGSKDFPYTFVSPAFRRGQRITAQAKMCMDVSALSLPQIVQPEPASLPGPVVDPVFEGADRVVVHGPGSAPAANGAMLEVTTDHFPPGTSVEGGQPTPGGFQQVLLNRRAPNPATSPGAYRATQALCTISPPGPPTRTQPCSQLPPAKIRQPVPGDMVVDVTQFVPGSEIRVYGGDGREIGDGGGSQVVLTRAIVAGEEITVVQSLGEECQGDLVYTVRAICPGADPNACSGEWPAFRHTGLRDGQQRVASALSDPDRVRTLKVAWSFPPDGVRRRYRASPIVYRGKVYVGNSDGHLYALDAGTGALLWQYPRRGNPPLTSQYTCNPSSEGIAASAAIGRVRERDAVIFGAPDQSIGRRLGSGRLFALDPDTGAEIWKSPEVAVLNGVATGSLSETHEQIGYSSPLVIGNRIYVGIANHCDNPIQNGRVAAVDANTGNLIPGFTYRSTATRGGGVWSSVAGGLDRSAVYITTGNVNRHDGSPEPSPNNGLSLLRLNATSGAVGWKLQPVPFALDGDPDWASGPTLLPASCGNTVASTQKDGWSYAASSGAGSGGAPSLRWQFPATGIPFNSGQHGDTRYLVPGAAWRDSFITMTGGFTIETGQIMPGLRRIHSLNVCSGRFNPVRWIADIPATDPGSSQGYRMGPPTVSHGIVFVGTTLGHLVALADPVVFPSAGSICSNPEVPVASCVVSGFPIVPRPHVLADIPLDGSSIFTEPVLAGGRVYVATDGGTVFMLEPAK